MKPFTAQAVLDFLKREGQPIDFVGDSSLEIERLANIKDLHPRSISWIKKRVFLTEEVASAIKKNAPILLVAPFPVENANTIITADPKHTFFSILNEFFQEKKLTGIHPTAIVESNDLGKNIAIGAHSYIGENVKIGDNVTIHHNVIIECPCSIGDNTEIFSGVVIGTEGYGYYYEGDIPIHEQHYMGVTIGKNVDIGANTCIDRGLLGDTVIGDNVKIDNMCHIAHNDIIHDNTLIIAGTVLCGSVEVGRNVHISPGSLVMNQAKIEDRAYLGLGSVVLKRVKKSQKVFGVPAMAIE